VFTSSWLLGGRWYAVGNEGVYQRMTGDPFPSVAVIHALATERGTLGNSYGSRQSERPVHDRQVRRLHICLHDGLTIDAYAKPFGL
jgi:hypothetical protein